MDDRHLISRVQAGDASAAEAFLAALHDRIAAHFALEERVMRDRGYREYREHKADHERLLDEIRDLGLEREGFSVGLTLRYLEEWMLRHVESLDRALGEAPLARGVR